MKRTIALSVLALTLAACGGPETIKIGVIAPLTGDLAGLGSDVYHGAELAVKEVNAAGGINGKQVKLIVEDSRCNSADGLSAAKKLIEIDGVTAIVGGACSSESLAAAPIANAGKVVMVSPLSSSPDLTKQGGEYFFRNYPSDALKGKALGTYLASSGYKNLAIINENTDFCQGVKTSVIKDLPQQLTVAFNETVNQGTTDFRTLLTRLKGAQFDVLLINLQTDTGVANLAKQLRELGIKQPMIGTDTADSTNIPAIAGTAAEGLLVLSVPTLNEATSTGSGFVAQFRSSYGEPKFGAYFAALSYDAANVLMKNIGESGKGEALKNALYHITSYPGVSGNFHFDADGDVLGIGFAIKEFKNGSLVQKELISL